MCVGEGGRWRKKWERGLGFVWGVRNWNWNEERKKGREKGRNQSGLGQERERRVQRGWKLCEGVEVVRVNKGLEEEFLKIQ